MLQDAQVAVLVVMLIGAGLAKLFFREPLPASPAQVHGVPVPVTEPGWAAVLRQSRPANVVLALLEVALGLAILFSSHAAPRVAVTLLLAAATWVVAELRERTPDAGCGCFGTLGRERIGRRSIARAALLAAAAAGTLGGSHSCLHILLNGPWQSWALAVLELALLAALSPEPAALLKRRHRPPTPCDRRRAPLSETYRTLRRSIPWHEHRLLLTGTEPLDIWREGCWRFLTYPALHNEEPAEVTFAVSTDPRHRTVRAAIFPARLPRSDLHRSRREIPAPAT